MFSHVQVSIYNGKNMSSMYNFTGEQVCSFSVVGDREAFFNEK